MKKKKSNDLKNTVQQMYEFLICHLKNLEFQWTHRKDQMYDHMEGNKCHQNPIKPVWQLSFGQFDGEKDGNNWKWCGWLIVYVRSVLI